MLGKMNEKVESAPAKLREQRPLRAQPRQRTSGFPLPIDAMDLVDCRVTTQHLASIGIDQRIDVRVGRSRLQ